MRKLLYIVPLLLGMAFTSCNILHDLDVLEDRLDKLEYDKVASITKQITSITNSIELLTDTDTELKGYIATLEKDVEQSEADIETLKAKDSAIEELIAELKSYVDSELKSAQDWATATFATLEQHNALATELASLKTYVEGVESSLNNAISALETSMKEWVNEQLTGYYTIAEIDAKLEALETATTEGDEALQKEIDALKESLAAQKTELTEAYTKAIEEAINTNNGVIDEKIAAEISSVNEKIGALEERLDSLEERISAVEDAIEQIKALDIIFGNTDELACLAGASALVDYTIVGGDEQTDIEAFGDGGWSANIVAESATAGKVVVTAPSEVSKRGKVVVLATSGAGGAAMKSLYFDEGVLTGILDTYEVDWEACTLVVTLKTNLSYSVEIPAEAQEWISIAETTRATIRTETITLSIAENPEDMPARSAVVKLVGKCGDVLQSFEVTQKLRPSSNPIVFADTYVKKVCVEKFDTNGDGELSYLEASRVKTLNTGYDNTFFGDYDKVVKSFDELQYFTNLTSIPDHTFSGCSNLANIIIPESVTSIGDSAFTICSSLVSIDIPDGVTHIGQSAFYGCSSLAKINIPSSVTSIEMDAFSICTSLKDVYIAQLDVIALFPPTKILEYGANIWLNGELLTEYTFPDGTVKIDNRLRGCTSIETVVIPDDVMSIDNYAFEKCSNLRSITIPESVKDFGLAIFNGCRNLTFVNIPDSITEIGWGLFKDCSSLVNITLPEIVTEIGDESFSGCSSLISVTIPDSVISIGNEAFKRCTQLSSVVLSKSVTDVNDAAFDECVNLQTVYCRATTPPNIYSPRYSNSSVEDYSFPCNSGMKIYVPTSAYDSYMQYDSSLRGECAQANWYYYKSYIEPYDFK